MNMMSVLLGATGILLVAALVLAFGSMNEKVGSEPSRKEIEALRTEIEVLNAAAAELAVLRQQKAAANPYTAQPTPITTPNPVINTAASLTDANQQAEDAARIAALEQDLADAQAEAERQAKRAETFNEEASLALRDKIEQTDRQKRQARVIEEALLIATVTEVAPEGFVAINILRPESAQQDTVLAIRRKNGVIGRVKISQIYPDGATADPLPGSFFDGPIDIQAGDELIIPPL